MVPFPLTVPLDALLPREEIYARRRVWTSRRVMYLLMVTVFVDATRTNEEQNIDNAPGMCWRFGRATTIWESS